jgi:hypothetical protein
VPVILSITCTQYSRWCNLVLLTLQRYTLDDHVSSDAPTLDDPLWGRMDNVVLSWLLDTITVDHQETNARDRTRDRTAQQLWVHLDAQFQLFVQGDPSIDNYCHKMKWMASNLGEHVEDRTLVLSVLWGLNKKYDHIKTYLKRARSFPSFHEVRNDLLLEDLTLDVEASSGSATAIAASGGQQQQPSPTPAQQCQPPSSPTPFGGPRPPTPPDIGGGRGGGGGRGNGGDNSNGGTTTPTTCQGRGDIP